LLGYGPGTYAAVLGTATAFTYNFGDPLDAHGFLQKVSQEEGIIGLALFVLFLIWFFTTLFIAQKRSVFHKSELQVVFLMAFGIVLFELFNTSYFNSVMWMPIGMGFVAMNLYGRKT
jgi:O-antigen ligase